MSNSLCSLIIFCSPSRNCRPSCTIPRFITYIHIITLLLCPCMLCYCPVLPVETEVHPVLLPSFFELFNMLKISRSALLLSCSPGRNFKLLHLILSIRGTTILQSATNVDRQNYQTHVRADWSDCSSFICWTFTVFNDHSLIVCC